MSEPRPLVAIVLGSDSDLPNLEGAFEFLESMKIPFECRILSAHRTPVEAAAFAEGAEEAGIKVIIAGAGGAAHLAGSLAGRTTLPVIGLPIPIEPLKGMDSLLSTVQMPAGIPVPTVAIGKPGATNAAIFAAQILALSHPEIAASLKQSREEMAAKVRAKDEKTRGVRGV